MAKHSPVSPAEQDYEDQPSADERIEDAIQAASDTHTSWKHRCHAVLTALGADFGDPDWEMPDDARKKDMLISSLLHALDAQPENDLHWPDDPVTYFAENGWLPARGKIVPFHAEISYNPVLGCRSLVEGDIEDPCYVETLEMAMEHTEAKYAQRVKAALSERLEDNGGLRRPHLAWSAESEANTPMGVFRICRGEQPGTFTWELTTHEGIQRSAEAYECKRAARMQAEKYFSRLIAQCFALGSGPILS